MHNTQLGSKLHVLFLLIIEPNSPNMAHKHNFLHNISKWTYTLTSILYICLKEVIIVYNKEKKSTKIDNLLVNVR